MNPDRVAQTQRAWSAIRWMLFASMVVAVALTAEIFQRAQARRVADVERASVEIAASLSHELEMRSLSVELLAAQLEDRLRNGVSVADVGRFQRLPDGARYERVRDGVSGPEAAGRLTGAGEIPTPGSPLGREIAAVLDLAAGFQAVLARDPQTPWVYYLSKSSFLYVLPGDQPDSATWTPELAQAHFSLGGRPVTTLEARSYWSSIYEDLFGKGRLSTVSRPVFLDGELMGTVSVDIGLPSLLRPVFPRGLAGASWTLLNGDGREMLGADLVVPDDALTHLADGTACESGDEVWLLHRLPPSDWTLAVVASRSDRIAYALRASVPYGLVVLFVLATAGLLTMLLRSLRLADADAARSFAALEEHNQVLGAARREADRANNAKSEFLAMMSHELRTPLNGVIGVAAHLAEESDPQRVTEGLHLIRQSADALLAVVNDVLDFSKVESGVLELEELPFVPEDALRSVVGLMHQRASEQGDVLVVEVDESVPRCVRADPTRFRQITINLVSNAIKFTRRGTVTCALRWEEDRLILTVRDTGVGISPAQQARLFTPFSQADASTTREFGGTGLGLAIVSRLAKLMGGSVRLESELGKGSVFVVDIVAPACVMPEALTPAEAPSKPLRVLVVEDNPVNQLVLGRLLERMGHDVEHLADGQAAIDALLGAGEAFDAVFMDCHMPVLDGFEATRRLRSAGYAGPVIAITAAVTTEDRARCAAAGMNGFVAKPVNTERLREALAAVSRA
jgi:signal transduction histidine kinase/ActR/RegA family two-component response regulator